MLGVIAWANELEQHPFQKRIDAMRTIIFSLLALSAASLMPTAASAEWYCKAQSPTGTWGEGWAPANAAARKIALAECAVRTPRGYVCVISACVP